MGKIKKLFEEIKYILDQEQIKGFWLLLIITFVGSVLETVGVSAVMPLVSLISNPSLMDLNNIYRFISGLLNIKQVETLILFFAVMLILIYILKNIFIAWMYKRQYKYIFENQNIVSQRMLQGYLAQDYLFHTNHNVADLQRNIRQDVDGFFQVLLSISVLFTEGTTCLLLIFYLLYQDFLTSIVVISVLSIYLTIIGVGLRNKVKGLGIEDRKYTAEINKWVFQALGGIKELKVNNIEKFYLKNFKKSYDHCSYAHINYLWLNALARPIMESVCIGSMLGFVAMRIYWGADLNTFIPIISAFVVAAVRILPSFSRITNNVTTLTFYRPCVLNLYNEMYEMEGKVKELMDETNDEMSLSANRFIKIESVTFFYPSRPERKIIDDISVVFNGCESIALIGSSGSGKTTLVDLILGVLKPQQGVIRADGINIYEHLGAWHRLIGYIPQTIYLIDDTIRANVALGLDKECVSDERIWEALKEAQLDEFVRSIEGGLDAKVGDRGVQLSGGQRQRIGIARALYRRPQILILDEATSALDNDTEEAVMTAINNLSGKLTMIIVAHRLSTIKQCDVIYEIKEGKIIEKSKADIFSKLD